MRRLLALPCLLAAALLSACSGGQTLHLDLVERDGPPFAEAFPEPAALLDTDDVQATRRELARVRLPATREHHDGLLALLDGRERVTADQLLLLVEAVHLPAESVHISVSDASGTVVYTPRGQGEFAPVVDELLLRGVDKVDGLTPRLAGRLMGRSHDDGTLDLLVQAWLPRVDDGSDEALHELVAGFHGSPALEPLLTRHLAPSGRLDGPAGWSLVERMSFDDGRLELIEVLLTRPTTVDGAVLERAVTAMAFDDGRARAAALLAQRLDTIDGETLLAVLGQLSFDDGRLRTLDHLAPRVSALDGALARRVLGVMSFDSGRQGALERLAASGRLVVGGQGLLGLVELASFDSGRLELLRQVLPHLEGDLGGEAARSLLAGFSFDSGRQQALEAVLARCGSLDRDQRQALVDCFSFDSNRDEAADLLGL